MLAAVTAAAALAASPPCHAAEFRAHNEAVFGHFATRAAARAYARKARSFSFQGIKIENDGCGDFEVEIDGADSAKDRGSFGAEAEKAGFEVTFEQRGEPLQPPHGQVYGVFARKRTVGEANALAWKVARAGFRYVDVMPSGRVWLVVMPQIPVRAALSIAGDVARAGFHIQFSQPK